MGVGLLLFVLLLAVRLRVRLVRCMPCEGMTAETVRPQITRSMAPCRSMMNRLKDLTAFRSPTLPMRQTVIGMCLCCSVPRNGLRSDRFPDTPPLRLLGVLGILLGWFESYGSEMWWMMGRAEYGLCLC